MHYISKIKQKKRLYAAYVLAAFLTLAAFLLCSCSGEKKELSELSRNMLTEYTAEYEYLVTGGESEVKGVATVSRADGIVTLCIASPEPYGGICAKYSADSLPDVIEITYEGITVDMPKEAFDRINTAMALFTDDFALTLVRLPSETVKSYSDSELHSVDFNFNGSDVSMKYDCDECFASGFTVSRDGITINAAATKIKRDNSSK